MTKRAEGNDVVEVTAEVKRETARAWQLYDGKKTEWVPKSLVEKHDDGTFSMPEWMAKDKGFI